MDLAVGLRAGGICLGTTGAIVGITLLMPRAAAANAELRLAGQAGMLALAGTALLAKGELKGWHHWPWANPRLSPFDTMLLVLSALMLQPSLPPLARPAWVAAVTAAALAEELVFRVLLPMRLERELATVSPNLARLLAVGLSQVTFAFAHIPRALVREGPIAFQDHVWVALTGAALFVVVQRHGLLVAVAWHTTANIANVTGPDAGGRVLASWVLAALCTSTLGDWYRAPLSHPWQSCTLYI